jgi:hypothetical protein
LSLTVLNATRVPPDVPPPSPNSVLFSVTRQPVRFSVPPLLMPPPGSFPSAWLLQQWKS